MVRIALFLLLVASFNQIRAETHWSMPPAPHVSQLHDDGECEIYGRKVPVGVYVPVPPSVGCYEEKCVLGGMAAKMDCVPIMLPPDSPCKVITDNTKPHPGCCPHKVCPGDPGF